MEDQKKKQAKQLELLIKNQCHTGELSDDELDGVSGGNVLSSNQVYQMRCPDCGWVSTPFDATDPRSDSEALSWQHFCFNSTCEGTNFTTVRGTVNFS